MESLKPKKFYMAPMAEITTPAFRRCVRSFSTEVVLHTEMLSASALANRAVHNAPLLLKNECDEPIVYQLLGSDPDLMARSCSILENMGAAAIDINMGCSAPDILKKCQGSMLLAETGPARELVRACRSAFRRSLSVKMRSGFTSSDPDYLARFAMMLQDEGIDYITLHPRHGKLGFKRTADWGLVSMLKKKLSIPVNGNGDINSPEEALNRLASAGCDGIMIGRRAVQEPWIFRCCYDLLLKDHYRLEVDLRRVYLQVLKDLEAMLPPELHKSRMHRFSFYYTKNFYFSHELFRKIRNVDKIEQAADILNDYAEKNPHENIKLFEGGGTRWNT